MANILRMAVRTSILTLYKQGRSCREIGRLLGVHRETVGKYVREAHSKPAKVIAGKLERKSRCAIHHASIEQGLEKGLTAQRIWQDLRDDEGFAGSYQSVKRYTRGLSQKTGLPFRRIEVAPGEEAQIDFGTGAWILDNKTGHRRRSWVLRVILSHSRKAYSEVVFKQDTENFIRCLENAFRHFGGVPKSLVIDNLKAAVIKADWYDPDLHPKIEEFARHYGTVILPTKPYTPRHKGKVEGGVKYVKNNALKARAFTSLQQENEFLWQWEKNVADLRIHGTTKKQVKKLFEDHEKGDLCPLPQSLFPFFHEGRRSVHRDGHVAVAQSFYSVPAEYLRRQVWVRWDARTVRVFNDRRELIATHARREQGRFSTDDRHIPKEKRSQIERGVQGIRTIQGLLALARTHKTSALDRACAAALKNGSYRLKSVRALLESLEDPQPFEFMQEHPLIRSMESYGEIVQILSEKGETHERFTVGSPEGLAPVRDGPNA